LIWPWRLVTKQVLTAEAGVALAAVGIQDPKAGSPPWWAGPIAGDDHLRSLADDVAPEPDPRSTGKLEPDARRLRDGGRETGRRRRARRLEHDEADPGTSREGGQAAEAIGESRARASLIPRPTRAQACGQVDDQQVDRSTSQQGARDREPLLRIGRGEHDEPLGPDSARDRLHGIERRGEIQPGDDRARGLGLGDQPQGERRPPARGIAPERQAHPAWDATWPEDGIELREAGGEDPIRVRLPLDLAAGRLERHGRERPDDLGSRGAPARSEGRQGRREVGRRSHRPHSIEQMFE
jgi:hypothetical protein